VCVCGGGGGGRSNSGAGKSSSGSSSSTGKRKTFQGLLLLTPPSIPSHLIENAQMGMGKGKDVSKDGSYSDVHSDETESLPPLIVGRSSGQNERISFQIGNAMRCDAIALIIIFLMRIWVLHSYAL